MLFRAQSFLLASMAPGLMAYTHVSESAVHWAKISLVVLLGFAGISVLFSLFEEEGLPEVDPHDAADSASA